MHMTHAFYRHILQKKDRSTAKVIAEITSTDQYCAQASNTSVTAGGLCCFCEWCCSTARSRGRFSPFALLFAAKPLHENGSIEPIRQMTIALEDDQALEDDLELARVGYVVVRSQ